MAAGVERVHAVHLRARLQQLVCVHVDRRAGSERGQADRLCQLDQARRRRALGATPSSGSTTATTTISTRRRRPRWATRSMFRGSQATRRAATATTRTSSRAAAGTPIRCVQPVRRVVWGAGRVALRHVHLPLRALRLALLRIDGRTRRVPTKAGAASHRRAGLIDSRP